MQVRDKIIQSADSLFKMRGAKVVTMDDISSNLGISKKTLYSKFSNKADVVQAVTLSHFESHKRDLEEINKKASDPIHEIILIMDWMNRTFQGISSLLIFDIQKYYPEAWMVFNEFRNKESYEMIKDNLEKGILAGLYRPDLDVEILARLRIEEIGYCMSGQVYAPEKFDIPKVHMQLLEHFLHGVVTLKGKRVINKYLNRNEEE